MTSTLAFDAKYSPKVFMFLYLSLHTNVIRVLENVMNAMEAGYGISYLNIMNVTQLPVNMLSGPKCMRSVSNWMKISVRM